MEDYVDGASHNVTAYTFVLRVCVLTACCHGNQGECGGDGEATYPFHNTGPAGYTGLWDPREEAAPTGVERYVWWGAGSGMVACLYWSNKQILVSYSYLHTQLHTVIQFTHTVTHSWFPPPSPSSSFSSSSPSFVAVGIVTHAAHSWQYRRQQTLDIFRYSFVLWWHLYSISLRTQYAAIMTQLQCPLSLHCFLGSVICLQYLCVLAVPVCDGKKRDVSQWHTEKLLYSTRLMNMHTLTKDCNKRSPREAGSRRGSTKYFSPPTQCPLR